MVARFGQLFGGIEEEERKVAVINSCINNKQQIQNSKCQKQPDVTPSPRGSQGLLSLCSISTSFLLNVAREATGSWRPFQFLEVLTAFSQQGENGSLEIPLLKRNNSWTSARQQQIRLQT